MRGERDARRVRRMAGFTLAETLAVVALIVILAGVAFVGVMRIQLSMRQLEMDGTAKELYVAAQNHLTLAHAQGALEERSGFGKLDLGTKDESSHQASEGTSDVAYYFVHNPSLAATDGGNPANKASVLGAMLPFGSIDDTVRLSGSYVIRYQPSTATVLDVFYTNEGSLEDGDFAPLMGLRDSQYRAKRRQYEGAATEGKKIVVGYYGGEDGGVAALRLAAPTVQVDNGDTLRVIVTNPTANDKIKKAYVKEHPSTTLKLKFKVVVTGVTSGAQMYFDVDEDALDADGRYALTLDDVTVQDRSFARVVATQAIAGKASGSFVMGEDLSIVAWATTEEVASTVAKAPAQTTNSLFGAAAEEDGSLGVSIASLRHLANLDADVSGFTAFDDVTATQTSDLSWASFCKGAAPDTTPDKVGIFYYDGTGAPASSDAGAFVSVMPNDNVTLSYEGGAHTVSGVSIAAAGPAGLFGELGAGSRVANLELVDVSVTATGGDAVAGALVGRLGAGATVRNVLVRNSLSADDAALGVRSAGAAGGLVGSLEGGAVEGCAAAVHVSSTGGAAGGLVGQASDDASITDSFAGGHTSGGAYQAATTGTGRINVLSSGAAGGLVGTATATSIDHCYATASAQGAVAGGLAGTLASGSVANCYATGAVTGDDATCGAFAGTASGTTIGSNNHYFKTVTQGLPAVGSGAGSADVTALDEDTTTYQAFARAGRAAAADGDESDATQAIPYDKTLARSYGGSFALQTIGALDSELDEDLSYVRRHYGDWPAPETVATNYKEGEAPSPEATQASFVRMGAKADVLAQDGVTQEGQESALADESTASTEGAAAEEPAVAEPAADDPQQESQADESATEETPSPAQESTPAAPVAEAIPTVSQSAPAASTPADEPASAAADDATSAPDARDVTLKTTLHAADGSTWTVTLKAGAEAEVPADAKLTVVELNQALSKKELEKKENKDRPYQSERFVSKKSLQERAKRVAKALGLVEDDRMLQDKYLDISLTAGGSAVTLAAPVELDIETNAIDRTQADAFEAALATKDGYEALAAENRSEDKDKAPAKLELVVDRVGELALAEVICPRAQWDEADGTEVCLWSARSQDAWTEEAHVGAVPEGSELLEAFTAKSDPQRPYGTTLWLGVSPAAGEGGSAQAVAAYELAADGSLGTALAGAKGTTAPVAFRADKVGVALVREDAAAHAEQDAIEAVELSLMAAGGADADADDAQDAASDAASDSTLVEKSLVSLEGSWASWSVTVNPEAQTLADGAPLTLVDSFTDGQSIDYASITVPAGVTYDYRGNTGTYVVPDATTVTISYRTRIAAQPGDVKDFGNTAVLQDAQGEELGRATTDERATIYPSASDVAGMTGICMVRVFVYGDANMQTGIPDAQFVLMDANQRPLTYRKGDNAGQVVSFTTNADGYADVRLDEEAGDVSIQKNTAYYLEMIKAPEGYRTDSTRYSFMITDDPGYESGGVWTYYNGDTIKVRLYAEEAGLNVSVRFSGNYELSQEERNDIVLTLQRQTDDGWQDVESHSLTDFDRGSLTFDAGRSGAPLEEGATYRVVEDNQRPWDLPSTVELTTHYYLSMGAAQQAPYSEPPTFTVEEGSEASSINVVVDNEYEEHKLTITKMDTQTGKTLPGATFEVRRASDDAAITSYTTDEQGLVVISGGSAFESETLYYVEETVAPEGYLLPQQEERTYFYFCNDEVLEPSIVAGLPAGQTAINLSESYGSVTADNQKQYRTIPVMATWQGNAWPQDVDRVLVGLYQSVDGADPVAVTDASGDALVVALTKAAPYNNRAFVDLPARDDQNRTIVYTIREEHAYTADDTDVLARYVQLYGVSDAGVYVAHNKEAVTLKLKGSWYDGATQVSDAALLAEQPDVTLDLYRSTEEIPAEVQDGDVTNDEMSAFVAGLTKVRSGLTLSRESGWEATIADLEKRDDLGNDYCYVALETVPSFGDETYVITVDDVRTITIKNQLMPPTATLTVEKARLVDDPRPEAAQTAFGFTLELKKGEHPIRSYEVADGLVSDQDGRVRFSLKPEEHVELALPQGVRATVSEDVHQEYDETASSATLNDLDDDDRAFAFDVTAATNGATVTFTNTLHVICNVVDTAGGDHPFESLKSALAYIRANRDSVESGTGTATIWMLEDYAMPTTDVFDVREGERIMLSAAPTDRATFPFVTSRTEGSDSVGTDVAIITRAGAGGSLLTNAGTLILGKVCLDGAQDQYVATTDGGLVHNTGSLSLSAQTTLRNSASEGKGGAIYSTGTIAMAEGAAVSGNSAPSGSALYLADGSLSVDGARITNNADATDGAVVAGSIDVRVHLSGDAVIYHNTNSKGYKANLYVDQDSDSIIDVVSPGLGADALVGVTAMETHREIGEQFATTEYGVTANLDRFVNDAYDYRGKLKDGTSTNVVWEGLTLVVTKAFAGEGTRASDTFSITISSASIRKSSYLIDGTTDYAVAAARQSRPGTITLNGVHAGESISISPLPVGDYTIAEAASTYDPSYAGKNDDTQAPLAIAEGSFALEGDSAVTVTNTRRQAKVQLSASLEDRLVGSNTVSFPYTLTLTEADGTPIEGFTLASGVVTGSDGQATLALAPSPVAEAVQNLVAPVGARLSIVEDADVSADYRVTASGFATPAEGESTALANEDETDGRSFAFAVPQDDVTVAFANVRKMATIELRKEIDNKVSAGEPCELTITLADGTGAPAANYVMYEDADDPSASIVTDETGTAVLSLSFAQDVTAQGVQLTIPEGTSLTVEETPATKTVDGSEASLYDTTVTINGGTPAAGTTAAIASVTESDSSIVFANVRKTQTVTVTNTVGGYSGNTQPFSFTATVTDGQDDDYDAHGFADGVLTFELATGQSKELVVPFGATLTVTQDFVLGYETTVKRGSAAAELATRAVFDVTGNETLAFASSQLINLVIDNQTSSTLEGVRVYVGYGTRMYRVNDTRDGIETVALNNHWATVSVAAGTKAILEVNHKSGQTDDQAYTVQGTGPAEGYYYTINNEPSFHEFADPAVLRIFDTDSFEVKGKLRYSVSDSTVTITEQPLVSYDVNGGAWTTEMEGYRDRDGDRTVYQYATDAGASAPVPPQPVYPTGEGTAFMGWTADQAFAQAAHAAGDDVSDGLYDFATPVNAPLTLYAVWAKPAREGQVVTVKNASGAALGVTATLTKDGAALVGHSFADGLDADESGIARFDVPAGESRDLAVPAGARLVLAPDPSMLATSGQFADDDPTNDSFTIVSVTRDGTVTFVPGVCKITDAAGAVLYDASGQPAVYTTLEAGFTAYNGTLYTDASHGTVATPAAVKMLVDEYAITSKHPFPTKDVVLTTAGKDDASFPYAGTRESATLYRGAGFTNDCLFTLETTAREVTLTNIVFDGKNVPVANSIQGGFIHMNNAGAVLNIDEGTVMRNVVFASYTNGSGAWGGALVARNGMVNVRAGLFSDLHARRGGALCVQENATLTVTGNAGSTRFENCSTNTNGDGNNGGDGGAIFHASTKSLTIDGGPDKANPGVIFTGCVAGSNWGDGGGVYVANAASAEISGCAFTECSARNTSGGETNGFGGGGISAKNTGSLSASHCTFTACDSMRGGGAAMAYVKTNSTVSFTDCAFDSCNCMAQGGALATYQDNNGATASTTTLALDGCTFANCSSGTRNGSGGAIQCYLPCLDFKNTSFTDCWAGKEGGAVNNWYGANDAAMWPNAYMNVEGCSFVRCRAEDRYDLTGNVHFGGGIATKAPTLLVRDSYFEDCVSTLKQGGAVHCSGIGAGSSATVEGSTFVNCEAKHNGGALMASTETMTVTGSKFYGCSSFAESGGALYHGNSVNSMNQATTTITGCTFAADPEGGSSAASCSAAKNGGAIWSRAMSVMVGDCTITDCVAGTNGGGVYLARLGTPAYTIKGGSITGCQAVNGSAVFQEGNTTYSGVRITGNTNSLATGGAVARSNGNLYFEGSTVVEGNTCSADGSAHDVVLAADSNGLILTTSAGLAEDAHVGVYTTDTSNAYAKHGHEGQPFGTYGDADGSENLDCFFNDRSEGLYGYRLSATDSKIYWGIYVCKITDAQGNTLKKPGTQRDAVYQRLSLALDDFAQIDDAAYIKMLVQDYDIQQTEQLANFPAAKLTLTTAGYPEQEADGKHPYRGEPGTVCTISRSNGTNQLFKLTNAGTELRLEHITMDGRRYATDAAGSFRLVEVAAGTLVVGDGATLQHGSVANNAYGGAINVANNATLAIEGGATLQHCKAGYGGAVYAAANARLTVSSGLGHDVTFEDCQATNYGGGAINAAGNLTIQCEVAEDGSHSTTSFASCTSPRGGALYVKGAQVGVDGATFEDCHSTNYEGGAINHDNTDAAATLSIAHSRFVDCSAPVDATWSYGGAVMTKAGILSVEDCAFENCSARTSGGAVSHGSGTASKTKTSIVRTTFDGCQITATAASNDYQGSGGSVYTTARAVEMTDCAVRDSSSFNYGGGLYLHCNEATSVATVAGTSFEACAVTRDSGRGGAIYSKARHLTLQDSASTGAATSISACTAADRSGAVHMATNNSTLDIGGSTAISGCYADTGAAVYLANTMTLNLAGRASFTKNGYTNDGRNATKGACIYLEQGSVATIKDSPTFSRNNITNVARITNGGTTDYVRQDLYLAGYSGVDATSIKIVGDLTLTGDSMIWVWPESSPHRLPNEQFAIIADGVTVSDESLGKFRNALADNVTTCDNGEYLAGVRLAGRTANHVYWDKLYEVSFKKIDNKGVGVGGAEFTLYTDAACTTAYRQATSQTEGANKGKVSYTGLHIGVFYLRETKVPTSFQGTTDTYLVLVGTPSLSSNQYNQDLWTNGGPLDVDGAQDSVAKLTTNVGKYFGIFRLNDQGKAELNVNLASAGAGIVNVRDDFAAYFKKVDSDGKPLPNAAFTIYAPVSVDAGGKPTTNASGYPQLELWSRDGENYPEPVLSADGSSSYRDLSGATLQKGMVYFRELPIGTYYLVESGYPGRNGNNRIAFYVEGDRVLQLEVRGEDDFVLRTLNFATGTYDELAKADDGLYTVGNVDAVCKLTDANGNLLYEASLDGETLYPAIYPSVEAGFAAAQGHTLVTLQHEAVAADAALRLEVLKDCTMGGAVAYTGTHELTLTTAKRTATARDRYVFATNRTSDTSRAQVTRAYSETTAEGALITVDGGATLALANIKLEGKKATQQGRAVRVASGSLSVGAATLIQNFRQTIAAADGSVRGGAVLVESGATLKIDGGTSRTAVFTANEASAAGNAAGGALALAEGCTASIKNAQFKQNVAQASTEGASGRGGALFAQGITLALDRCVFTSNVASQGGGALCVDGGSLALSGVSATGNQAATGSVVLAEGSAQLTVTGGSMARNRASAADGGAINLTGAGAKVLFEGSPTVWGNTSAANTSEQRNVVLDVDSNQLINTTAKGLTGGKIGVYVTGETSGELFQAHGLAGKPFGSFGDAGHLKASVFRNDRNQALYGVENEDDATDATIYWAMVGIDVSLAKTDGFGERLNGATFALFTDAACTTRLQLSGADAVATSATLEDVKGTVRFEMVPSGVYFLKETAAPEGFAQADDVYVVVVGGGGALEVPAQRDGLWATVLADVTQADLDAQAGTGDEATGYAVFALDAATGKAVASDAVAAQGIVNVSATGHHVMLRKADKYGLSLEGAIFQIYRMPVKANPLVLPLDATTSTDRLTSDVNGVFYVGELPYGTYYLNEVSVPTGYKKNGSEGWWYTLTVSESGATMSVPRTTIREVRQDA